MESVDTLDTGMVHVLGGTKWDGARLYHATQTGMQFKISEWPLIFRRI